MAILPRSVGGDEISAEIPVRKVALTDLINPKQRDGLLRREAYFRCTQHDHKAYDFDGHMLRFGESTDVKADGYVAMKRRQPSIRMDLAKVIVDRLTAMVYGHEHYPTLKIDGDDEAEDYVRTLSDEASLPVRMVEARNLGGATGTAVLSWGFIKGVPVVDVHQRAFVEVLEWADYEARKPAIVVKVYEYKTRVWDKEGKPHEKRCYYARYWDSTWDIVWRKIPEELAKTRAWWTAKATVTRHDAGFCPVYWCQNLPCSSDVDGISDYESQEGGFDELDILLSATSKGTKANVDPTLLIKDDVKNNEGVIHKGSGHAIYSKLGANYIELAGTSIAASRELMKDLRQFELDKAAVVLHDPEKATGSGISAAAMKLRFAPMLSKCDLLRGQYGPTMVAILTDMLKVSRTLREVKVDAEGVRYWSRVALPTRMIEEDTEEEDENGEERKVKTITEAERTPGTSERLTLDWPPYFGATWEDRKTAVETVKAATGGQQVVSKKTAVDALATMFGITDVEAELERIEDDTESQDERAGSLFERGAPGLDLRNEPPDDEEGEQGSEPDKGAGEE